MKVKLSDGEWKLMSRLWEHSPMTIMELTGALHKETGWSKHTVITMLSRLEAKGAVHYEAGKRAKRYYPDVTLKDAARTETESFLDKIGGGSLGVAMNAMVSGRVLTQADIDELSEILDKAKRQSS